MSYNIYLITWWVGRVVRPWSVTTIYSIIMIANQEVIIEQLVNWTSVRLHSRGTALVESLAVVWIWIYTPLEAFTIKVCRGKTKDEKAKSKYQKCSGHCDLCLV